MGRYLANGVVTNFRVKKAQKRFHYYNEKELKLEKEINGILKNMNKIIDTSMYKIIDKKDDCFEFVLKPEIFDENIHELIKEISDLTYPNYGDVFRKINIDSTDFINKCHFKSVIDKDNYNVLEVSLNAEKLCSEISFYDANWLIDNEKYEKYEEYEATIEIYIYLLPLWMEIAKYDGEDEYSMLKIINNMKTKYYKSKLAKAFVYYVSG